MRGRERDRVGEERVKERRGWRGTGGERERETHTHKERETERGIEREKG